MAVPTRDAARAPDGRAGGARAAAGRSRSRSGSLDLGGAGLSILDRDGTSRSWAAGRAAAALAPHAARHRRPRGHAAASTARPDHAIAYTTSAIPGWTIVIDQPRSVLFADARRGFFLELALVAAAGSIVLFLIGFILLRGRREAERERTRARQRRDLSRILGSASLGSEVSDGLVAGLSPTPSRGALHRRAGGRGSPRPARSRPRPTARSPRARPPASSSSRRPRRSPTTSGAAIVIGKEPDLRATLPGRPPGAARSRALVLRDAARHPRRQPARRALPAVRAHASARRERAGAGRAGTPSRPRRRSTARRRSSASTRSRCACSAACSRTACPRSRASS